MTDITDPGSISNGDTPDWDVVQTYFDAIYAVINSPGQLDNNNIKTAAAIAYSKLALTGSVTNADLAGSIVTDKIARPTVSSATSAGVSISAPSTWYDICTVTPAVTGLFFVAAAGGIENTYDATSYTDSYLIRLWNKTAGSQIGGVVMVGSRIVATNDGASYSFGIPALAVVTAGNQIALQVWSNVSSHATVPSNRATLQAARISA